MIPAIQFLQQVLGDDGTRAFQRANQRAGFGPVLAPRTIISWLSTAVRSNYEGEIPGLSNSYLALNKSDAGFTGALTIGDQVHSFERADLLHVAASIAVALGLDQLEVPEHLKDTDISRLGKSIDMLVKARVVSRVISDDLAKGYESLSTGDSANRLQIFSSIPKGPVPIPSGGSATAPATPKAKAAAAPSLPTTPTNAPGMSISETQKRQSILSATPRDPNRTLKTELPGKAAGPKAPKAPDQPSTPTAVAPSTNKTNKPKLPMVKREIFVKKSEAVTSCAECGLCQFRYNQFVGCMCFRALAKHVNTEMQSDSYRLTVTGLDPDEFRDLLFTLKGN